MTDLKRQPTESISRAQQIDAICDRAEAEWRSGERPRIEDLIAETDGHDQITLLGELIWLEIYYRQRRSETVTAEEYAERFPQVPADLISIALSSKGAPRRTQAMSPSEKSSLSLKPGETIPFVAGQAKATKLPRVFGRYQIVRALGRGAMGVVYLARDTQLDRNVALKVPQLSGPEQEELIERFYREARAAAALRHPHVCPVFDVGQIGDQHFISMAFIEGHALSKYINPAKPQKPQAAANLIRKIALGMQEAHQHGIVHRDLKPGNIMIDSRCEPMVMDFGLARDFGKQDGTRVTQTGMLVGTPAYMSPEQIEGDQALIGPATDIWSLGVILYEVLTSQMPFPGNTIYKVINNIQHSDPKPLAELRPDLPPELAAICHQMMSKSIADRPHSMAEVAEALAHICKSLPVAPPIPPPIANRPEVETITLKISPTVKVPRQQPAIQYATAALTKVQLWHLVAGLAAVCVVLVAVLIFSRPERTPEPKLLTATTPKPSDAIEPLLPPIETSPPVDFSPPPAIAPAASVEANPIVPALLPPAAIATNEPKVAEPPPRLQLETLIGKKRAVGSIAITADGKFGFSAAIWPNLGAVVHKWDLTSGKELLDLHGRIDAVGCDAKGERVLTGDKDGTVMLLDGLSGEEQSVFRLHTSAVNKVAVSPDGRWGASASNDRTLRLWNLESREAAGILGGVWDSPATQVAFSPDSRFVAGAIDSEIVLMELESHTILRRIRCGAIASSLEFSPDGTQLVSSHTNGFVLVWDVATGRMLQRLLVGGVPRAAQFMADEVHLLVAGSDLSLHCINSLTGLGNVENRAGGGSMNQFSIASNTPAMLMVSEQPLSGETQLKIAELFEPEENAQSVSYLVKPPPPNSKEGDIAEWILKMGGKLLADSREIKSKDDLVPGRLQRYAVILDRCPLQTGDLACLKGANLETLSLSHTSLEDKELVPLTPALARIRSLMISHSMFGDAALQLLATNRSLYQLNVEFSQVTDAELAKVLARNKIGTMHCDSSQLTQVIGAALTDPIFNLTVTARLNAPTDFSALGKMMPQSLTLYADPASLSPQACPDLSPLQNSPKFTSLHMNRLAFTPEDLRRLATHHQLEHTCFKKCEITRAMVDQVRTDLPRCEVIYNQ